MVGKVAYYEHILWENVPTSLEQYESISLSSAALSS